MTRSSTVMYKDGNIFMEKKDVLEIRMEYVSQLYEDERGVKPEFEGELEGPSILQEEIERAIKGMKNGKATGTDEMSLEIVKAAGDETIPKTTELTNQTYD